MSPKTHLNSLRLSVVKGVLNLEGQKNMLQSVSDLCTPLPQTTTIS